MRFTLIDRIVELEPGRRITALKALTMAEEYLGDHFPHFPVMPGVLMLEAMTQAGAWLIRASEDFAHTMVVLESASNVRYGHFVQPGHTLTVSAEIVGQDEHRTRFKAQGRVDGVVTVNARLVLRRYNVADTVPSRAGADEQLRAHLRSQFCLLFCSNSQATPEPSPAVKTQTTEL